MYRRFHAHKPLLFVLSLVILAFLQSQAMADEVNVYSARKEALIFANA